MRICVFCLLPPLRFRQGDAPARDRNATPHAWSRRPILPQGSAVLALLRGFVAGANFLPAARPSVGLQDFLAEADGLWRDLDEFVVGDEFDGLLEAQFAVRNQSDGFVGARRAHVGLL